MHAEDAPVDQSTQSKVIKDLAAMPPHARAPVLALALFVEAVDLCDLPRFVVAPDERHAVWIADLERQEEEERLYRVEAAVDKVTCPEVGNMGGQQLRPSATGGGEILYTHEEICRVWTLSAHSEQLHQVVKLGGV